MMARYIHGAWPKYEDSFIQLYDSVSLSERAENCLILINVDTIHYDNLDLDPFK